MTPNEARATALANIVDAHAAIAKAIPGRSDPTGLVGILERLTELIDAIAGDPSRIELASSERARPAELQAVIDRAAQANPSKAVSHSALRDLLTDPNALLQNTEAGGSDMSDLVDSPAPPTPQRTVNIGRVAVFPYGDRWARIKAVAAPLAFAWDVRTAPNGDTLVDFYRLTPAGRRLNLEGTRRHLEDAVRGADEEAR